MSTLIDKIDTIDRICEDCGLDCPTDKRDCPKVMSVWNMPQANKSGEWKSRKSWSKYVCSECSFENDNATNYCPNCGAFMRG